MLSRTRKIAASAFAATVAVAGFATMASADSGTVPRAAAEEMPSAVEYFNYPGADRILAEEGIELKRGDGRIVLAECGQTSDQIRIYTVADQAVGRKGTYCFRATANSGYLTLELPRVFGLETSTQPISADLTAEGRTQTVDMAEDTYKSVGEGTVGGAHSVLVEIRVTG
ncbi:MULTISPECIES: hypothetical protein [unclassified Streptomyces]|uniref:hypothetical protein n=1 Tax=unclassified Streptomyces TaxID=2593676 RepID=UPI0023499DCB|nr:hypothetical protein [Streptomyces sp. M92]WCN00947.1 hypothetical protein M6G08_02090 [Streptomyces sp. M92]